jgi:DNA-binding transcriptional ArsR family regulator
MKILNKDLLTQAHNLSICLKTNWDIFSIICKNEEISVTDIMIAIRNTDQSTVSRKLSELRSFDLVSFNKYGTSFKYYVTDKALRVANSIKLFTKKP